MNKYFLSKDEYLKLFLILSFFSCWASISSSTSDVYKIFLLLKNSFSLDIVNHPITDSSLYEIINFSRQLIMFIIFPILLFLNISKLKIIDLKKDFPFFCFLMYFIFQIPGLFITHNSFMGIGFVISSINVLLILNLSKNLFDKKFFKYFLYLCLFFLILINILNIKVYLKFFYSANSSDLYTYYSRTTDIFLGVDGPRSTGSARSILIIYILSIFLFERFFNTNKKVKIILYIFIATFILLFQSRTVLVLLLTFIIFNYLAENYKYFLKYIVIYLMLPIVSLYSTLYIKNLPIVEKYVSEYSYHQGVKNSENTNDHYLRLQAINDSYLRPIDPATYSSGRVEDWKHLFRSTLKSKYFGYGSQADRFLIHQTSSNGLLYAFSSSGIIGVIFYIVFLLSCLFKVFNILIKDRKNYAMKSKLISIIILIMMLRSNLESSFSVFGIDFIIMTTCYSYLIFQLKDRDAI